MEENDTCIQREREREKIVTWRKESMWWLRSRERDSNPPFPPGYLGEAALEHLDCKKKEGREEKKLRKKNASTK